MTDTFVPLVAAAPGARESGFAPLDLRALPLPGVKLPAPEKTPIGTEASAPPSQGVAKEPCGKPVVTLQRTGEVVSSIRVQCTCGQVIELNCLY